MAAQTNGHHVDGEAISLPIIDVSKETPETGRQMIDAAIKYGFFYIDCKDIDFNAKVVDGTFELVRPYI